MFGSTVIEVGIGMALLFLFASLIATAAQEFLGSCRSVARTWSWVSASC